jgi:uncharacterized protein (TIGR01777 family)
MNVLLTGSHGFVGSELAPGLLADGHSILRLVRSPAISGESEIYWNPGSREIDLARMDGIDAVVHLAGENLAAGRWTPARKTRIRESRVTGTRLLSETLGQLRHPPAVLLSASAVGYYGNRGDQELTEASPAGQGFLAEVCRDWEDATAPAAQAGVRVAQLRFGIVFGKNGGALAKMILPFQLGLGGRLGHGEQYWSWITLEDVVAVIRFALRKVDARGPINVVAPQPVTNREFTRTLAHVLGRPAVFPAPAFALRLALGEMADAALLSSSRAVPAKLTALGFRFRFPDLRRALMAVTS